MEGVWHFTVTKQFVAGINCLVIVGKRNRKELKNRSRIFRKELQGRDGPEREHQVGYQVTA
jgi:hypothetical protein